MKVRSIIATALLFGGSLVYAQVCPPIQGSVCLVPARSASTMQTTYVQPSATLSTSTIVPYSSGMVAMVPMMAYPTTGMNMTCPTGMSMAYPTTGVTTSSLYQTNVSTEAALLAGLRNDVRSLQGEVRAASIELRGQQLVDRMDRLMADEMLFRQQLAINPNMTGAQAMATALTQQAQSLNRDISAFNSELAAIPTDQRPYLASRLNTFTTVYWNPTVASFSSYSTQFAANAGTAYQPALAANPWLPSWQSNYQTALIGVNTTGQTIASSSWWTNTSTMVAGMTEVYPSTTNAMMCPQGVVMYVPASSISAYPMVISPPAATLPTTGGIVEGNG